MLMRTVLVTNVTQYAGPGALGALLRQHARVVCHDRTFREQAIRDAFRGQHPGTECLASVDPVALVDELRARDLPVDAVVSNDVHPITRAPIGEIDLEDLSREVASFGIQVNVVAPNYLYSE